MKSFTLHLFVLFIIAIEQNVYSSSLLPTKNRPAINPILSSFSTGATIFNTSSLPSFETNPQIAKVPVTESASAHLIEISKNSVDSIVPLVSKSSQETIILDTNKEKTRTARDFSIKNLEPSLENCKGNNRISCITPLLKDESKKNYSREEKQNEQQKLSKLEEQVRSLNQASQSLWHETQQINRVRRTSKTPRTIQRLIAGHLTLSNDPASSTTKIQPITTVTNIEIISSTPTSEPVLELEMESKKSIPSSTTTRTNRKPYRSRTYGNILRRRGPLSTATTTTSKSLIRLEDLADNKKDDDEAFLEDAKELDNWDNGILRSSAGDGREDKIKSKKKLDPNKTLSEQVKDGKYGLIEEEIFKNHPKRPGILSYLQNKEFPHDNEKSLGGLNEEDIWLAEDHLLVIKGGGLNDKDKNEPWAPIDDYIESSRPIKIPDNPKIPPPFPIQLGENEPIQFVGDNKITFDNPSFINDSSADALSIYSAGNENKNQIEVDDYNKENISTRKGPYQGTTKLASVTNTNNKSEKGYFYPRGNPVWSIKNGTLINPFFNFKPFDFPPVPPNGSIDDFLDQFDEDDESLYYPPPYSFVYKSNYTNSVPAGPLVPGIVLPPPPNAFGRLETETTTRKLTRPSEPTFRQKLTRLQEYKSKPIIVTPHSITSTTPNLIKYSTSIKSSMSTTTTNLPPFEFDLNKDEIYTITEAPPSYGKVRYYTPSNKMYTTSTTIKTPSEPAPVEEENLSFVPQIEVKPSKENSLSLKKPIYYEYYDVKPTPSPTPEVYYKDILPPTLPPSPTIPLQHTTPSIVQPIQQTPSSYHPGSTTLSQPLLKPYSTRKHKTSKITTIKPVLRKPHKYYSTQGKTYLTPRPYNFNDYINIKPHPEIRPNGIAHFDSQTETINPIYNRKPQPDFDREINSIRQTLQFFNGQEQHSDYHQSTHKPKPIYEYSFDTTTSKSTTPRPQFDTEPFQPMIKYSSPVDDVNGFRAITYPETNDPNYYNVAASGAPASPGNQNNEIRVQIIYDSTPRPEKGFYSNSPQATHSTLTQSQNPWISIEKQVVHEIGNNGLPITTRRPPKRRPSSRKIEQPHYNKFDGYYYDPPQAATSQIQRTNNRYFEEPFTKHLSEIRKKLGATNSQPHQSNWNLTNFEYVTPRPTLNSNIEPFEQFLRERTFEENSSPTFWQSENTTNPSNQYHKTKTSENLQQQQWLNQQQQQQPAKLWSLESDINVNNIPYGRPQMNPDAEFIEPIRQPSHHKSHREKYKNPSKSVKQNHEPFEQYLREVTPRESIAPQSQNLWALESQTNEPYARPTINRPVEILEQSSRPSHHYNRQQQLQQLQQLPQKPFHKVNSDDAFKQYLRKISSDKNKSLHPPQVWRLENDTNVNKLSNGRPKMNSNPEFLQLAPPSQPQQHRRPVYRELIREFVPPHKMQQQQQTCKWPQNCNANGNQNNGQVLPGHPLHGDININYGQKFPPINPNSEFINAYQPFINEYKQQPQQQLELKPIYNRPHPMPIDSTSNKYYQQESYQNNNNQRHQRQPK